MQVNHWLKQNFRVGRYSRSAGLFESVHTNLLLKVPKVYHYLVPEQREMACDLRSRGGTYRLDHVYLGLLATTQVGTALPLAHSHSHTVTLSPALLFFLSPLIQLLSPLSLLSAPPLCCLSVSC